MGENIQLAFAPAFSVLLNLIPTADTIFNDTICKTEICNCDMDRFSPSDGDKYNDSYLIAQTQNRSWQYLYRITCGGDTCPISDIVSWSINESGYVNLGNGSPPNANYVVICAYGRSYDRAKVILLASLKNSPTMLCRMYVTTEAQMRMLCLWLAEQDACIDLPPLPRYV